MKVILLLLLIPFSAYSSVCPIKLEWEVKTVGKLVKRPLNGVIDFIFLDSSTIAMVNFIEQGKKPAPIDIFKSQGDHFVYDEIQSKALPKTFHARQMILEDLDGDGQKEVIIADHGPDYPPFPGAPIVILKKVKGQWANDPIAKNFGVNFTFNVSVLRLPDGNTALYKTNFFRANASLFVNRKGQWKDDTSLLPVELQSQKVCYMTAINHDFDGDGQEDLYLGGCDRDKASEIQKFDRILSFQNKKWKLSPDNSFPARPLNSQWGTVFVKKINYGSDKKTDLLVASHDFGFHSWKTFIYENKSTPGHFKFDLIELPLKQEPMTEGYVNSMENFDVHGFQNGILAEVRTIIRDPKMKYPKFSTRFLLREKDKYFDASECLPDQLKKNIYQMKKFPGNSSRVLMVPFEGDILSVKVSKQIK